MAEKQESKKNSVQPGPAREKKKETRLARIIFVSFWFYLIFLASPATFVATSNDETTWWTIYSVTTAQAKRRGLATWKTVKNARRRRQKKKKKGQQDSMTQQDRLCRSSGSMPPRGFTIKSSQLRHSCTMVYRHEQVPALPMYTLITNTKDHSNIQCHAQYQDVGQYQSQSQSQSQSQRQTTQ